MLVLLALAIPLFFLRSQVIVVWDSYVPDLVNPWRVVSLSAKGYLYLYEANVAHKIDVNTGQQVDLISPPSLINLKRFVGTSYRPWAGYPLIFFVNGADRFRIMLANPDTYSGGYLVDLASADGWDDVGYFVYDPYYSFFVSSSAGTGSGYLNVRVIRFPNESWIHWRLSVGATIPSDRFENYTYFGLRTTRSYVVAADMLDWNTPVIAYSRLPGRTASDGVCVIDLTYNRPHCVDVFTSTSTYRVSDVAVDRHSDRIFALFNGATLLGIGLYQWYPESRELSLLDRLYPFSIPDGSAGIVQIGKLFLRGRYLVGVYVNNPRSAPQLYYFVWDTFTSSRVDNNYLLPYTELNTYDLYSDAIQFYDDGVYVVLNNDTNVHLYKLAALPILSQFEGNVVIDRVVYPAAVTEDQNIVFSVSAFSDRYPLYYIDVDVFRLVHDRVTTGWIIPRTYHYWYREPVARLKSTAEVNGQRNLYSYEANFSIQLPNYVIPLTDENGFIVDQNAPYIFVVHDCDQAGNCQDFEFNVTVLPAPPSQPAPPPSGVQVAPVVKRAYTPRYLVVSPVAPQYPWYALAFALLLASAILIYLFAHR